MAVTDLPDNRKPRQMANRPEWQTDKFAQLEAALGESLGAWLKAAREKDWPNRPPSWQDIAYDLRAATGLRVTHESCRTYLSLYCENGRQEQVT